MSRQLVINADDYGLNPAVSIGILRAHRDGLVTSASVVVGGEKIERSMRWLKGFPNLGIGLHANFIDGLRPTAPAGLLPTLAPGGKFRINYGQFARDWALGRIRPAEVERELLAQAEFMRAWGFPPTHLDFHNYLHLLPGMAAILARVARVHEIAFLRVPRTFGGRWSSLPVAYLAHRLRRRLGGEKIRVVASLGFDETGSLDGGRMRELIRRRILTAKNELLDLTVHPHVGAGDSHKLSRWNRFGREELGALCDQETAKILEGVRRTNYAALAGRRR